MSNFHAAQQPARPAPSRDAAPLDMNQLVRRCMGRIELAERLLASFDTRFPNEMAQIEECLAAGDTVNLVRLIHQLKGAAGNVSAAALHASAARLEETARAGRHDELFAHLDELRYEWTRFREHRSATASASGQAASTTSTENR